jgi:hypothetical protein
MGGKPSDDACSARLCHQPLARTVVTGLVVAQGTAGIARRGVIRWLEDQANASRIVRDVGILSPLTRCRSGLTGTRRLQYRHETILTVNYDS